MITGKIKQLRNAALQEQNDSARFTPDDGPHVSKAEETKPIELSPPMLDDFENAARGNIPNETCFILNAEEKITQHVASKLGIAKRSLGITAESKNGKILAAFKKALEQNKKLYDPDETRLSLFTDEEEKFILRSGLSAAAITAKIEQSQSAQAVPEAIAAPFNTIENSQNLQTVTATTFSHAEAHPSDMVPIADANYILEPSAPPLESSKKSKKVRFDPPATATQASGWRSWFSASEWNSWFLSGWQSIGNWFASWWA